LGVKTVTGHSVDRNDDLVAPQSRLGRGMENGSLHLRPHRYDGLDAAVLEHTLEVEVGISVEFEIEREKLVRPVGRDDRLPWQRREIFHDKIPGWIVGRNAVHDKDAVRPRVD